MTMIGVHAIINDGLSQSQWMR